MIKIELKNNECVLLIQYLRDLNSFETNKLNDLEKGYENKSIWFRNKQQFRSFTRQTKNKIREVDSLECKLYNKYARN